MADGKLDGTNTAGIWSVTEACIDCDAARQVAPELIAQVAEHSVFLRQSHTEAEWQHARQAMLVCPVGAVSLSGAKTDVSNVFPLEIDAGVFLCGYNSRGSYAASASSACSRWASGRQSPTPWQTRTRSSP